jgi:hypothetical protein
LSYLGGIWFEVAMNRLRMLAILLGFVALAATSSAQDEEPEDASPPATEDAEPPPAPNPDDVFIPTEEIPVDEEVTFPVNI